MPYKNIVFVKLLWKELLHGDNRWIEQLDDDQKGLYLMLLVLAGATTNNIKADSNNIKRVLNLHAKPEKISENLKVILRVFPKIVLRDGYLKFKKFKGIHNPIRYAKGMPSDSPQARPDKNRIEVDKK